MFISSSKIQSESKSQLAALTSADLLSVYQFFKDTIWKQITTNSRRAFNIRQCLSVLQRYNLKANHNRVRTICKKWKSVYQFFKDTIWKQITTGSVLMLYVIKVFISSSKIQSESKSQPNRTVTKKYNECLSVLQRYNLKANHNPVLPLNLVFRVFISSSKIQSESKSQLTPCATATPHKCLSVLQRYNLKANHNTSTTN